MSFRSLILGIYCAVFSTQSYANEPLKSLPDLPSSPAYLIKLVAGLVLVLIIFSAFAWVIRRLGFGGLMSASGGELKIVESLSLGSREKLIIIQAGKDKLLLGITPSAINTLHLIKSNSSESLDFTQHLSRQQKK